jgi:alginate O-acetyltransferase complex protein AlgJ
MAQPSRALHAETVDGHGPHELCGNSLAGYFMAAFHVAALLVALLNPALLRWPGEPLLNGSWTAAYQEAFDSESPLLGAATVTWGVLEYALLREGRAGVLVGADGWLFSTEEFAHPADPARADSILSENLAAVAGADRLLAADGVQLVVALLPAKARLYPEQLGRYLLPAGPEARYRRSLNGLRELGVPVVDLLSPLEKAKEAGEPVFLRTDTHWTPHGAALAAEAIAEAIVELGNFDWIHGEEFATIRREPVPLRGDLTRFLPLGPFYQAIGPRDDLLRGRSTTTDGPGNDLFAEVELPVTLVGTSYSADERWNFAGALRQELGAEVLVAAERGEGPYRPMIDYLAGAAYLSTRPEVVVWEIPERYLSAPLQEDGEE